MSATTKEIKQEINDAIEQLLEINDAIEQLLDYISPPDIRALGTDLAICRGVATAEIHTDYIAKIWKCLDSIGDRLEKLENLF